MAYVAVKGGERAIDAAHDWLARERRGAAAVPEIGTDQIATQLGRAVDRVMAEGSCYDPGLAALAIKQAQGDLIEAAFLLRAYRTTLPRFASSLPVETAAMLIRRRISAIYKDLPGGQVLGPTYDYTHRLLDFSLAAAAEDRPAAERAPAAPSDDAAMPRVMDLLDREGLMGAERPSDATPGDLTREPLAFPAGRDVRLQALARGDEGFLLALGYSTQRGYGLCFGHGERKAMGMALVDRAMRAAELGEDATAPAQNIEFVLSHSDNIEATGFVEHLKLPHYVDFQSELETIRRMRRTAGADVDVNGDGPGDAE